MTVGQLKHQYLELFGESSRSNHKQFLFRRIAWRIQVNALGTLSDRARHRALEIANHPDLRIRPPKSFSAEEPASSPQRIAPSRDPRLPIPGTLLLRRYQDRGCES